MELTLKEIEQGLEERLAFMAKLDDFEWEAWLAVYQAFAQVKQAQAMEKQNHWLEQIARTLMSMDERH